ncbi:MAG: hypothetical protein EAZ74_06290 [Alphaproteobacteria bacterium]|nr:MAG: hypothetical protein EAY76_05235 [Alphaproteobacteria bacterium]TAF13203.1 MAG: hypothetical protein EAZ74_06290 [Alphaproteobacteria bacterium]TAF77364.1 MAG: hypothetical protein EAZ52_00690 [Alphaproteobacteria bacterium]
MCSSIFLVRSASFRVPSVHSHVLPSHLLEDVVGFISFWKCKKKEVNIMADEQKFNPDEMPDDPDVTAMLIGFGLGGLEWFGQLVVKALRWIVEVRGIDNNFVQQTFDWTHFLPVWAVRSSMATWNAVVGAVCMLPPGGAAYVALVADIFSLIEAMIRVSFGVGASIAHHNKMDVSALDPQDYVDILALWVGDVEAIQNETAKTAFMNTTSDSNAANRAASKGAKSAAKAAHAAHTMGKAAKSAKFFGKTAAKVGVKVTVKASGKIASATSSTAFPGLGTMLGAAGNASINAWIMSDISHYAEMYYNAKFGLNAPR